jgi:hypothetical protein
MVDSRLCPVQSAHRRLRDVHQYWHDTAESYMDPDGFRRSLNSAIQELRNVSFLVQKEKDSLPGFDTWYTEWQNEARQDPVMRWIVESRNRIVKQGDLDLLSSMTARYHVDWVASGEISIDFPPRTPLLLAAHQILEQMGFPPFGFVTIRRRWTDYALAGRELLDALNGPYSRCAELLDRAHGAVGADACPLTLATSDCPNDTSLPECMANADRHYEVSIDAASGQVNSLRHVIVHWDEATLAMASERYGSGDQYASMIRGVDAIGAIDGFLHMGRQILAVEDDVIIMVAFFDEAHVIHMESAAPPADHFGKVLLADQIATTALNKGAHGVLVSADSWFAPLTHSDVDIVPLAQRSDRREALWVVAATKDGKLAAKWLPYTRHEDGTATFEDVVVDSSPRGPQYLEALRRAWGVAEWRAA